MIVIVAGMHRSGTSALAGVLHNNGIIMGDEEKKDFYPPPMKENPKGFFENIRFRRLNDSILSNSDYRVKSFSPDVPTQCWMSIEQRMAMRKLIDEFTTKYDDWGWKDPRTSLTITCWLSMLAEMRLLQETFVLNVLRSPFDVANSMRVRGNKEKHEGQFEAVCSAYHNTLFRHLVKWKDGLKGYAEVFFNGLICNPDITLEAVSARLGRKIENNGFIEYSIAKNIDRSAFCAREEVGAGIQLSG